MMLFLLNGGQGSIPRPWHWMSRTETQRLNNIGLKPVVVCGAPHQRLLELGRLCVRQWYACILGHHQSKSYSPRRIRMG